MLSSNEIYIVSIIFSHTIDQNLEQPQGHKKKCIACHKNLADINLSLGAIIQPRSNPYIVLTSRPHFSAFFHKGKNKKPWERFPHAKTKRMCCQKITEKNLLYYSTCVTTGFNSVPLKFMSTWNLGCINSIFFLLSSSLVFCVVLVLTMVSGCFTTDSFCSLNMLYIVFSVSQGTLSASEIVWSVASQEYVRKTQRPSSTQTLWSWSSKCPFHQQHSLNAKQVHQLFPYPLHISRYKKN